MAIKGAKTIAEYAIRKWLENEGFQIECFDLEFAQPNAARLTDRDGDSLLAVYDKDRKSVILVEPGEAAEHE